MTNIAYKIGGTLLALIAFAIGVYVAGYDHAKAIGKANLNALKVEYAEEQRKASDAYGSALSARLEAYQASVLRANEIEGKLIIAKKSITASRINNKEIGNVADSSHIFSVGFVRLYNQAINASDVARGETASTSNATRNTPSGAPADAQLSGVSEADLLNHISYYGARCQELEQKQWGWLELPELNGGAR